MTEWTITRRRFAMLPLVATAFALPGVLGRGAAAEGDATQLLTDAAAEMAKLQTFRFELSTVQGESTILRNLELVGVKGVVKRPSSFEATITAKVAIVEVDVDLIGIDGRLWVTDPLAENKRYIDVTGGGGDAEATQQLANLINPDRILLAAVGYVDNPVIDGTETIDGDKTTRITGSVDLGRIKQLQFATPEASDEVGFGGLILGVMPITIWIDEQKRVRSMELEGQLTGDESADVIRRLDLTDFDEPVDIAAPDAGTPAA